MGRAKVVAVANQKGGVGKTTTAVNMAAALVRRHKRVLLVDSDPQGNASSGVGVRGDSLGEHLYHCYTLSVPVRKVMVYCDDKEKFGLIPSSIDLAAAEMELFPVENREFVLSKIIEPLLGDYDYVVIDCPPSLGLLTINALTACDSVLIPMQCEYYAMEGLAQLIKTIRSVKRSLNKAMYVEGLLLTMFDKRNRLTYQVEEEIKKHFGELVFDTVIPRNVRLSECPSHGKTVIDYDIRSPGAKSYISFGNEFLRNQKEKG